MTNTEADGNELKEVDRTLLTDENNLNRDKKQVDRTYTD